jgi:hypothetical protein
MWHNRLSELSKVIAEHLQIDPAPVSYALDRAIPD